MPGVVGAWLFNDSQAPSPMVGIRGTCNPGWSWTFKPLVVYYVSSPLVGLMIFPSQNNFIEKYLKNGIMQSISSATFVATLTIKWSHYLSCMVIITKKLMPELLFIVHPASLQKINTNGSRHMHSRMVPIKTISLHTAPSMGK